MYTPLRKLRLIFGLFLAISSQQASAIVINLDFGDGDNGLTASQQSLFSQAESFWENTLTGYQPSVNSDLFSAGVSISASGVTIDGAGDAEGNNVLAQAGWRTGWYTGGYALPVTGIMEFDIADLDNMETAGILESVIVHEMAHVLGFGTLWTYNNVYVEGSGQYTGAAGLAAYQAEFDPFATFVPVGTSNGHWAEEPFGGGLTGFTDANNNVWSYELMTPYLNSPTFMSNTTIQSFVDIGYTVSAVPEPATIWLFISGLGLMFGFARKRQVIG